MDVLEISRRHIWTEFTQIWQIIMEMNSSNCISTDNKIHIYIHTQIMCT